MGIKGRVWVTIVAGIFLGLEVWVSERAGWPTAGLRDVFSVVVRFGAAAALLIVPLIVARWWVVLAMVGPGISLTIMQILGFQLRLDDTTGPAWNYRTVFTLGFATFVMLVLAGLAWWFDTVGRDRFQSDHPG